MRNLVRTAWILIAVLGLGALISCGDEEGGPTVVDPTQVRVTVRADGTAEPGVAVALFASGGTTALENGTTAANGQVTFEVDAGSYDVEVDVPEGLELASGSTGRRATTVSEGTTAAVTFDLVTPTDSSVVEVTVGANGLNFSPSNAQIKVGTTVLWRNANATFHTITPDGHNEWASASVSNAGDTFQHTFDSVGSFPYYCQPHRGSGMTGTITVEQ